MQISFKPMLQPQHTRTQKKTVRDPHPPSHRLLASFSDARDLGRWKVFSDAAHGGTTEASLAPSGLFPGTAEFRGALAGPGAAGRARSGFAGMTVQLGGGSEEDEAESEAEDARERLSARAAGDGGEAGSASSRPAPPPLRAPPPPPLDLSAIAALRLRVRNGDGRPWVVSLRTENWLVGDAGGGGCHDVWQAFLFAPDARKGRAAAGAGTGRGRAGAAGGGGGSGGSSGSSIEGDRDQGWTTAELPLSRFLLTHRGRLVEARVSMNAARVVSLGLAPAPLPSSPSPSSSGGTFDGGRVETGGEEEAPPPAAEGAFCLGLECITAVSTTRGLLTREEAEEAERVVRERELRERREKLIK